MRDGASSILKTPVAFHPWVYFWIFLTSNIFLSYFQLPFLPKLWIGVFGFLLPCAIGLYTVVEKRFQRPSTRPRSSSGPPAPSAVHSPPAWFWACFAAALLLTRFYRLTTVPFWPMADEGAFSTLAVDFMKNVRGQLLWGEFKVEPLLIWSMGIFFKVFGPSYAALRLFPALVSIFTSLLAYWAARQFFSRTISFTFCWILSFSFWDFTYMRLCSPNDLILPLQFLSLGSLGLFLKAGSTRRRWIWVSALSFSCGLGFYAHTNWPVFGGFLGLALGGWSWTGEKGRRAYFFYFCAVTTLLVLPLLGARFTGDGMHKIQSEFTGLLALKPYFNYAIGLFWNGVVSYPVGPIYGGLLNPLTGALVPLGVLWLAGNADKKLVLLLGVGSLLCLQPGTMTTGMELHRVTPLLPFVALLAAFGVENLSFPLSKLKGWLGMAGLFLISLGLDVFHFAGPYCDVSLAPPGKQWRTVYFHQAYQILKHRKDLTGPLYVFSEFNCDYDDKTLNIPVYPFDALQNEGLARVHPAFAALVVHGDYGPFLKRDLKGVEHYSLNTSGFHEALALFLIPTRDMPLDLLNAWIEADRTHRRINSGIMDKDPSESWEHFADVLLAEKNKFPKNRFLTSIYWERMAFFQFLSRDFEGAIKSYRRAIQEGYPAAHLYHNLAVFLKFLEKKSESEKAFEKAKEARQKIPL